MHRFIPWGVVHSVPSQEFVGARGSAVGAPAVGTDASVQSVTRVFVIANKITVAN